MTIIQNVAVKDIFKIDVLAIPCTCKDQSVLALDAHLGGWQGRYKFQSKSWNSKVSVGVKSLYISSKPSLQKVNHKAVCVHVRAVSKNVERPKSTEEQVLTTVGTVKTFVDIENIVWPSPDDDIPFWKQDFTKRLKLSSSSAASGVERHLNFDPDPLHVMHVTAEMAPIAKVGGLGDVVTGLARACMERGHRVEVLLPFYECISKEQIMDLNLATTFSSYHNGVWVLVNLYRGKVSGVSVLLVQPSNHFFKGSQIYGGSYNELEAYLFFSRACLEWMQVTGNHPDIIHVHEWQTGALPLLYWDVYHHLSVKKPRIVLTIHNLEHYGECSVEELTMCGLDGRRYCSVDKAVDDRTIGHNPERLSLLKGGIVYSNAVTTVSPTYVNETLCSGWLAGTLMQYREKYKGILNGIDSELWDPIKDPYLPAPFGAKDLRGKHICKHYVQRGLGLQFGSLKLNGDSLSESNRSPLVICITRLVAQKGIHLIRYAMSRIEQLGGQFVLLGIAPDGRVRGEFEFLANQYKASKKVKVLLTYSEELAHMLYAGADIVLIPSMFEPCGLTQMIGMKYGVIPLVRKTGGLADTVFDVEGHSNITRANGFIFEGIDEGSFNSALERAFNYYFKSPIWWMELVSKVMQLNNSWNKSVGEYIELYNYIRARQ